MALEDRNGHRPQPVMETGKPAQAQRPSETQAPSAAEQTRRSLEKVTGHPYEELSERTDIATLQVDYAILSEAFSTSFQSIADSTEEQNRKLDHLEDTFMTETTRLLTNYVNLGNILLTDWAELMRTMHADWDSQRKTIPGIIEKAAKDVTKAKGDEIAGICSDRLVEPMKKTVKEIGNMKGELDSLRRDLHSLGFWGRFLSWATPILLLANLVLAAIAIIV